MALIDPRGARVFVWHYNDTYPTLIIGGNTVRVIHSDVPCEACGVAGTRYTRLDVLCFISG